MNTRSEEQNTGFYSYLACFVKQSTGHTHTGHTDREDTPDTGTHTRTTRPPNEHLPQALNNAQREHIHLEYVRIHVIYRVNQADYVIHVLVVAPQEYVHIFSTRRDKGECLLPGGVGGVHGAQLWVQRRKRVLGDLGQTNGISWMSTKFGSQQKQSPEDYRRKEDQHLYIEIQP